MVSDLLLSQPGWCGGPLRLFDDDSRYLSGLAAASSRLLRKGGGGVGVGGNASGSRLLSSRRGVVGGCTTLLDSSPYLHSRWAAVRIRYTLGTKPLFVVVLSEPVERAARHWRSLQVAVQML